MKSRATDSKGSVYGSEVMGKIEGFEFVGLFFLDWHRAQPLM